MADRYLCNFLQFGDAEFSKKFCIFFQKGLAKNTYRQMGDIDFLVLPEHFERARLLMLGQNYQIQHYGMRRWPALKKYPRLKPLLTPFAWFWQLCRYLHLGLKREQPLKGLMQDVKKTRTKDAQMIFSVDELKAAGFSHYKINQLVEDGTLLKLPKWKILTKKCKITKRHVNSFQKLKVPFFFCSKLHFFL